MPLQQVRRTRWIDDGGRAGSSPARVELRPGRARPTEVAGREAVLRALDLVGAAAGLAVLALPIALIALAVRIDSRGPVLYRCRRVGRDGVDFDVLKFRKMRDGAVGPPLTVRGDRRLTRLGALLVRSKLDELPQLWNVLRGEMSLVGPRPEARMYVELHRRAYLDEILRVRPGITGLSQLAFGYSEAALLGAADPHGVYTLRLLPQKVELDRRYVAERSLRLNLAILWWTLVAAVAGWEVSVDRRTCRLRRRRRPIHGQDARAPASPPSRAT